MVRGHDKNEWNRTSMICAAVYNASGNLKRQVSPSLFNPYAADDGSAASTAGAGDVTKVSFKQFVKGFSTERRHG